MGKNEKGIAFTNYQSENTYEIEVDFFYHAFGADVWNDVFAFCGSPDNAENLVYVQSERQFGYLYDEPRRLRTGELNTTSRL